MVTTMKGDARAVFVLEAWSRLYPTICLHILSESRDLIELVHERFPEVVAVQLNAPVLEYSFYLKYAVRVPKTDFVGFVNGDIVFSTDVVRVVQLFHNKRARERQFRHFCIFGSRSNMVPCAFTASTLSQQFHPCMKRSLQAAVTFMDVAQDYWIFDRTTPLQMSKLAPYRIGGVLFDNLLTALFIGDPRVADVDASPLITALHVEHSKDAQWSHGSAASAFNRQLHNTTGGGQLSSMDEAHWHLLPPINRGDPKHSFPPPSSSRMQRLRYHTSGSGSSYKAWGGKVLRIVRNAKIPPQSRRSIRAQVAARCRELQIQHHIIPGTCTHSCCVYAPPHTHMHTHTSL
jgi:hypothetical protein